MGGGQVWVSGQKGGSNVSVLMPLLATCGDFLPPNIGGTFYTEHMFVCVCVCVCVSVYVCVCVCS